MMREVLLLLTQNCTFGVNQNGCFQDDCCFISNLQKYVRWCSNIKKIILLSLLVVFTISRPVQALDWNIAFVVWEGNVFEVKQEEIISNSEIGKVIGEVKTKPNDMTGNYYGDASNHYPIGTKYYEIKGISTSNSIAIKDDNQWVKAVYIHKAPFHIMNVLTNQFFIFSLVIISLIIIGIIFRSKKRKNKG